MWPHASNAIFDSAYLAVMSETGAETRARNSAPRAAICASTVLVGCGSEDCGARPLECGSLVRKTARDAKRSRDRRRVGMRSGISKLAVSFAIIVGACGGIASTAGAATPAEQGCVGSTFSSLATAAPRLGQGVVGFAQDPTTRPGLGDGIQALQAGQVPDEVVPNSCN